MSTFVLVPGAWLGAWVWRPVAEGLRELSHEVHPLTLPGLAERAAPRLGFAEHADPPPGFTEHAASGSAAPPHGLAQHDAPPPRLAAPPPRLAAPPPRLAAPPHGPSFAEPATGFAHRVEQAPVATIGLSTHVADVRAYLEAHDLRQVILVGHSYAGIVTGSVASAEPDRVARAVFLDANVPIDGVSMTDTFSERGRELVREQVEAAGGYWPIPEPDEFDGHELTSDQINWLLASATPHPGQTLFDPASLPRPLSALAATYIHCIKPEMWHSPEVERLRSAPGWSFEVLETGHWPMVSAPEALVRLFHEIASA